MIVIDGDVLLHYLSIPYVAEFEVVEDSKGEWWCQGEYPELPDTLVRRRSMPDTVAALEETKAKVISSILSAGHEPPEPRPPLMSGVCGFLPEIPKIT